MKRNLIAEGTERVGARVQEQVDRTRQRIAEELFEYVAVPHVGGAHFRRRGESDTLCGRNAVVAYRPHPTEKLHNACFAAAFAIVDDEANRRMHAAMGLTVGVAPHAKITARRRSRKSRR